MSAFGPKQTSASALHMSAFGGRRTLARRKPIATAPLASLYWL